MGAIREITRAVVTQNRSLTQTQYYVISRVDQIFSHRVTDYSAEHKSSPTKTSPEKLSQNCPIKSSFKNIPMNYTLKLWFKTEPFMI